MKHKSTPEELMKSLAEHFDGNARYCEQDAALLEKSGMKLAADKSRLSAKNWHSAARLVRRYYANSDLTPPTFFERLKARFGKSA